MNELQDLITAALKVANTMDGEQRDALEELYKAAEAYEKVYAHYEGPLNPFNVSP